MILNTKIEMSDLMVKFDFENYKAQDVRMEEIIAYSNSIDRAKAAFIKENKMNDWYDIDKCITPEEIKDINNTADYIRSNCDAFIVLGIGGSYLGAKGVIDALNPYFKTENPEIIFAGNSFSSEHIQELIDYISNKEVMINVISKSGSTLETILTFNLVYRALKNRYDDAEIQRRIIVTTDRDEGTLLEIAKRIGCKRYIFPENIGGRFSTLTAVGFLPMAVAGISINSMLEGARAAKENSRPYYTYTALRDILYKKGKNVEIFNVYEPKLESFLNWVKQIFAETQGKNNKGILPMAMVNTRDLHSLGQFLQDGTKMFFETSIEIEKTVDIKIDRYDKYLDSINSIALHSVAQAHNEKNNGVTNIIQLDMLSDYNMGYLIFFFQMTATLGAYIMGMDYSDQPGVNAYKDLIKERLEK